LRSGNQALKNVANQKNKMKKTSKKKKNGNGWLVGGVFLLALMGSVASYFLGGDKNKNNRAKAKAWMTKARDEVMRDLKRVGRVSEKEFERIITKVQNRYAGLKSVDNRELKAFISDMRKHWKEVVREVKKGTKKAAKTRAKVKKKK